MSRNDEKFTDIRNTFQKQVMRVRHQKNVFNVFEKKKYKTDKWNDDNHINFSQQSDSHLSDFFRTAGAKGRVQE